MNKSFPEILTESFLVLRKSFLSILGLYIGMLLVGLIGGILSALVLGRQAMLLPMMVQTGNFDPELLSQFAPQLITIGVFFFLMMICFYFIGFWMILITRNNALIGQSLLKQSFFEMLRKTPKLILLGILLSVFFVVIIGVLALLFKKIAVILIIPLMIFCMPLLYMISYGMVCGEGNFFEIISNGISLGIHKWFRIVGYALLFVLCFFLFILVVTFLVYFITKVSNVAGAILNIVIQFVVSVFSYCFYTVFYLDLAEIKPQIIEEIDITTEPQTPVGQ